jgi:hypothetical protein
MQNEQINPILPLYIYRRAAAMLEHNLKLKEQQKQGDGKKSISQNLKEDRVYKTIQGYLKETRL